MNSIKTMTLSTFYSTSYLSSVGQDSYKINLPVSKWIINEQLSKEGVVFKDFIAKNLNMFEIFS